MFRITETATSQFQASLDQMGEKLPLRLTARKTPQNGMMYKMGFDDKKEEDILHEINGIQFIVDPLTEENVTGMIVDFKEFEGQHQFIFINPNDTKDDCGTDPKSPGCNPDSSAACSSCMGD